MRKIITSEIRKTKVEIRFYLTYPNVYWAYVIFFAWSLSPSLISPMRDAPVSGAPKGGHRGVAR